MADSKIQQALGLGAPFIEVFPVPIIAERAPTSNDKNYPQGQEWWDNSVSPRQLYVYAGQGVWNSNGGFIGVLPVANGGTGDSTLTAHGVLIGEGTSPVAAVAPSATSGVALVSAGASADPHYATVVVAGGGTGATSLTAHGVLVGEGTSAVAVTAAGTDGQVLTGVTGGDPIFAGPGASSGLTAHGVVIAEGSSPFAATAAGTTGQVLIGATGADPAFGELGVNSNLTGLVVGNTNSAFTATTYTAAASFTPEFSLATAGDSAWTYTTQFGRYTQLGAVVYFSALLTWSNFTNGTGSGVWRVSLPVAAGAFTLPGQLAIQGSGIDASAETANLPLNFYGKIATGASVCTLSMEEGGVGNAASASFDLTVTQVKTAGTLTISGFYFAA